MAATPRRPSSIERTQNTYVRDSTKGSSCRYVDTLFPHPYVAFVHHANPPCGMPWVNNVGLFGDDFTVSKRPDRYVVLLTGGSVASQLGQNAKPPAPRYFEEELNNKYVSPNGKPFLVLNGGDGAWKQPQSFILFSLYATSVDAVVTLDGFNEHYFFWPGAQERLERPLSNFIDVNPFVADENFGDAAIGWVMGRLAGTLALNPDTRPVACGLHGDPRHRGRRQGQGQLQVQQEDDAQRHVRHARGYPPRP